MKITNSFPSIIITNIWSVQNATQWFILIPKKSALRYLKPRKICDLIFKNIKFLFLVLVITVNNMLTLIDIQSLLPHEEIIWERLSEVKEKIQKENILDFPIVVDSTTKTILDGHHRYNACLELWIEKVPVFLVDYFSEQVNVEPFRSGENITKELVLSYSQNRKLFPPETTKHSYHFTLTPINYPIWK